MARAVKNWVLVGVLLSTMSVAAAACGSAVCVVEPDTLALARVITFDDLAAGMGPGIEHREVLVRPGARFGEHFLGQSRGAAGTYDTVDGAALPPLVVAPGPAGEGLSVHRLGNSNVINGFGPSGFPRGDAQGEGALAVLFDNDQAALAFDVIGGEDGAAQVLFLGRDGQIIGSVALTGLSSRSYGFRRAGDVADIAGIVITNTDPQGIAIDNVRFDRVPQVG